MPKPHQSGHEMGGEWTLCPRCQSGYEMSGTPLENMERAARSLENAKAEHMRAMVVFGLSVIRLYAESDYTVAQIAAMTGQTEKLITEWIKL